MRASRSATEWRCSWGHTISCNEETHSTTFVFFRPRLFLSSEKQRSCQTALQRCRDRRSEPCFGQTNDVTVSDVPLETNPGSKIVHLIIQGLDIGEQNTRQGGTVSPFPQPVRIPARSRGVSFASWYY